MEFSPARKAVPGPLAVALAALVLLGFLVAGPAVGRADAASLVLYKNALDSAGKRSQVKQYGSKARCNAGGSTKAFRFSLGQQTKDCFYRIPVVGKSVEVTGVGVLLKSTPTAIRGRTWLAVSTRQASNGSRYQLTVFPAQRKIQLRKVLGDGQIEYLAVEKSVRQVAKPGGSNRMTLRAFDGVSGVPSGTTRIVAWVNGVRIAVVDDPNGSQLSGRFSTFSIGSGGNAYRATGSFRNLAMRIPDPFG
jgi:hypothetical protein